MGTLKASAASPVAHCHRVPSVFMSESYQFIYIHKLIEKQIQYGKTYDSLKSIRFFFMFSHLKLTVHTSKSMSVGLGAGGREGGRGRG